MFQGFVFDVEGTLVDSVEQNLRSLQDALEISGHRVPVQALRPYSGLDGDQNLQLVIPEASGHERSVILEEQRNIFERDYLPSVEPFVGIRDIFRTLVEQGGRVALATDCKGAAFRHYMSIMDADEFIAATACGDDVEHGKPDPRLIGTAMRKLAVAGTETVLIGDTPYDAEAGLEAGTKVAGVLTGGFARNVLEGAGCFAVARDLRALLPNLLFGEATPELKQSDWLRSA
jgi:phosphoglycolate phosphatase-like HAD superfamily hydrolase